MPPKSDITVFEFAQAVLKASKANPTKYSLEALDQSEKAPYGFVATVHQDFLHVHKNTIQNRWTDKKTEILAQARELALAGISDTDDMLEMTGTVDTDNRHDTHIIDDNRDKTDTLDIPDAGEIDIEDAPELDIPDVEAINIEATEELNICDTFDVDNAQSFITREDALAMMQEMEDRLARLINAERAPVSADADEPSAQAKQGKKYLGARGDLRVKLDAALLDRLRALEAHYAGNLSRAVDVIIWRGLNRPLMSYELPEAEQKRLRNLYEKPFKKMK
jgi:hypothetical protein